MEYGIEDEVALLSGYYKNSKYLYGKQESKDNREILDIFVRSAVEHFRELFEKEFSDLDESEAKELKLKKASAWYMVTFERNRDSNQPFYGLPWTVSTYLCHIMKKKRESREDDIKHDCLQRYAKMIDNALNSKDDSLKANTAEGILNEWLKRICKKQNKSTLEMEKKLRAILRKVEKCSAEAASPGYLIMRALQSLIDQSLSFRRQSDEQKSPNIDTIKLGLLALTTMHQIFITNQIGILLETQCEIFYSQRFAKPYLATFYLCLVNNAKFSAFACTRTEELLEMLKKWSEIESITCVPHKRALNQYYFLVIAKGDKYSLAVLRSIVSQPDFYKKVGEMKMKGELCVAKP